MFIYLCRDGLELIYMERLQPTEGSSPDPVAEWSSPGGETGLEGEVFVSFNLILVEFELHFCLIM